LDKILVADDELSMREFLEILLRKERYDVRCARDGKQALEMISSDSFDLVICDMMMPGLDGMKVLAKAKELDPDAMFVMITAFASPESAVEAMKLGAYDYITKPFQVDQIKLVVKKALEKAALVRENLRLQREVEKKYIFENLVGTSRALQDVFDEIRQVAPTRSNILISGESGTGKELAAKAIHYNSPRRDKPFVTVNCGAIPSELLESELFGHVKGSFTGAYHDKKGLFETAHRGTVFLDEIGEMPLPIQVKLLRAIQDKTFKPVGGVKDTRVDLRIISATNRDLEDAVNKGEFREDLYYRINVIQIRMPPLRDHMEDVPLLVTHFLKRMCQETGKNIKGISPEAEEILESYNWPGNVRELENTIERAVSLARGEVITPHDLPQKIRSFKSSGQPLLSLEQEGTDLDSLLQRVERELIEEALQRSGGVKSKAAQILGISFRSLRYRLEKLGIEQKEEEKPQE